jgi:hypothetical protein
MKQNSIELVQKRHSQATSGNKAQMLLRTKPFATAFLFFLREGSYCTSESFGHFRPATPVVSSFSGVKDK